MFAVAGYHAVVCNAFICIRNGTVAFGNINERVGRDSGKIL